MEFSYDKEYAFASSLSDLVKESEESELSKLHIYALIEFDHSAVIALNSKVLGSKLDTDVHTTSCRLAFEGNRWIQTFNSSKNVPFII